MATHGMEMFGAHTKIRAKALEMVAYFSSQDDRDGIDGWWELEHQEVSGSSVWFSFNLLYDGFAWTVRAYNTINGTVIFATECLICEVQFGKDFG